MNIEKKSFSNFPLGKTKTKKKKISWIIIVVLFVVFVKFLLLLGEYQSREKEDLSLAVRLNFEGDFPNPKEGTAIFNFKLPMDEIIYHYTRVPKYIVFTESKTIQGLILRYNVHDSVMEGGLPIMKSEEITFLDNTIHEIVYTFKEDGPQKFFFDGREIASGSFDNSKIGISGFAVSELDDYEIIELPVEGNLEIYDKAR